MQYKKSSIIKNRVSIIVPLYGAQQYIGRCLESLVHQTYKEIEIIIINDCTPDKSMDIVRQYASEDARFLIIENEKNLGVEESRNIGLSHASGEYIALMDNDDICPLNRIEIEVAYLQRHPDVSAVGGYNEEIDADEKILYPIQHLEFRDAYDVRSAMLFQNILPNGSMMVRKEKLEEHGLQFRKYGYGIDDYYIWVELVARENVVLLPYILLNHRTSQTNLATKMIQEYLSLRDAKMDELHKILWDIYSVDFTEKEWEVVLKGTRTYGRISLKEWMLYRQCMKKAISLGRFTNQKEREAFKKNSRKSVRHLLCEVLYKWYLVFFKKSFVW